MAFNILAAGMVTPVGYDAASSCAAIRVGIDGFVETGFTFDGEWLRAAAVPEPAELSGREKLLGLAADAINECLNALPNGQAGDTALLLCLAERARPGRLRGLDESFDANLREKLAHRDRLHPTAKVFVDGALGAVEALRLAEVLLERGTVSHCVVAGADSYLQLATLEHYHARRRLVTAKNADGFLPGEAAAAVLVSARRNHDGAFQCLGIGLGEETATQDSEVPLRADGLVRAYRDALAAANCGFEHVDYRLTDISGDQHAFKEASLALARTMRVRKEFLDLWHPSDCVGRVGAASLPLMLGVALAAARRLYAPGPGVLCHVRDEDGRRAALVLREYGSDRSANLGLKGTRT